MDKLPVPASGPEDNKQYLNLAECSPWQIVEAAVAMHRPEVWRVLLGGYRRRLAGREIAVGAFARTYPELLVPDAESNTIDAEPIADAFIDFALDDLRQDQHGANRLHMEQNGLLPVQRIIEEALKSNQVTRDLLYPINGQRSDMEWVIALCQRNLTAASIREASDAEIQIAFTLAVTETRVPQPVL